MSCHHHLVEVPLAPIISGSIGQSSLGGFDPLEIVGKPTVLRTVGLSSSGGGSSSYGATKFSFDYDFLCLRSVKVPSASRMLWPQSPTRVRKLPLQDVGVKSVEEKIAIHRTDRDADFCNFASN